MKSKETEELTEEVEVTEAVDEEQEIQEEVCSPIIHFEKYADRC